MNFDCPLAVSKEVMGTITSGEVMDIKKQGAGDGW